MPTPYNDKTKLHYYPEEKALKTCDRELVKKIDSPLGKCWDELEPCSDSLIKRYCNECEKNVLNIEEFTAEQVQAIVKYDPEVCFYFTKNAPNILFHESPEHSLYGKPDQNMRVIYTARSVDAMNQAVKNGYKLLFKAVENRKDIGYSIIVEQNPESGEVTVSQVNYQSMNGLEGDNYWHKTDYKDFPVAAYLIPDDLKKDEVVWLDDLIQDIGKKWANFDDCLSRVPCSKAVWNGEDFIIDAKENLNPEILG